MRSDMVLRIDLDMVLGMGLRKGSGNGTGEEPRDTAADRDGSWQGKGMGI